MRIHFFLETNEPVDVRMVDDVNPELGRRYDVDHLHLDRLCLEQMLAGGWVVEIGRNDEISNTVVAEVAI